METILVIDDKEDNGNAGMNDYMSKPFNREDLQKMIREWVHKTREHDVLLSDKRILIVDDEEKVRKTIIRLLKRRFSTARLMWAEDGIDATAKLGSFMPDLILADIMMPGMDGLALCRKIRRQAYLTMSILSC